MYSEAAREEKKKIAVRMKEKGMHRVKAGNQYGLKILREIQPQKMKNKLKERRKTVTKLKYIIQPLPNRRVS